MPSDPLRISTVIVADGLAEEDEWIYDLKGSEPLPIVDLVVSPLSLVFGEDVNARFYQVIRRHYGRLVLSFRAGSVVMLVAFVAKAQLGRYLALVAVVMTLGTLMTSFLLMSTQLLGMLWMNHEVIFMSIMNFLNWLTLASLYRDARSAACALPMWGIQLSICSDAMYRTLVSASKSSVIAIVMVILCVLFVFLHMIDVKPTNYRSFRFNNIDLEVVEVFLNVSVTLCVLVARNIYRRRRVFSDASMKLITCALLKSRLVLALSARSPRRASQRRRQAQNARKPTRPASPSLMMEPQRNGLTAYRQKAPAISFTVRSTLLQATYDRTTPHLQQLRIVPSALCSIDGRNTLIPRLTPTKDLSRQNLVFLYLNGILGLLLTIISFLVLDSRESVSWSVQVSLQVGAYLTSIVFLGTFTAAMEKQLLRSLSMQFDLLFNVVQFILAAVCMADMLQFDARCLAVHTMTIWFFWILHVDALTPRVRKHLGFKKRYTGWALIAILACLIRVVVSLVFDTQNHYDDSMIASIAVIHGVTVQLRTKSVFLNRIFPITVWALRMLWELLYRREDELVFIRGTIEYYCPLEMLPVSHNSHTKHAAVVPSAESIQSRGPSTDRPEV